MNTTFLWVSATGLMACLVTTSGIYIISRYEEWSKRNSVYFMSFAAGVLITVSFLHLIPHAIHESSKATYYLLSGYLILYLLNRFLNIHLCHDFECPQALFGIIPMIGIGFHSLIDGIIFSVTFNVDIFTGSLAALGMIMHEFPEGIIIFILLSRSGYSRRKSMSLAFLAAALTTPVGALISYPFIKDLSDKILGFLLAISAGALLYVAATHLMPQVVEERKRYSVITLFAGLLTALGIISFH